MQGRLIDEWARENGFSIVHQGDGQSVKPEATRTRQHHTTSSPQQPALGDVAELKREGSQVTRQLLRLRKKRRMTGIHRNDLLAWADGIHSLLQGRGHSFIL